MLQPDQNLRIRVVDTIMNVHERRAVIRFMKFALGIQPHQVRVLVNLGGNADDTDHRFRQRREYAKVMLGISKNAKPAETLRLECMYESCFLPGKPYDEAGLKYLKPKQMVVEKEDKLVSVWYELGHNPADLSLSQLKDMLKDIVYILAMGALVQRYLVPAPKKERKPQVKTKVMRVKGKLTCVPQQAGA